MGITACDRRPRYPASPSASICQPNAIAVGPWLAGQHRDLFRRANAAALQCLAQNLLLHSELRRVARVLILAAAACAKVRACGRDPLRGRGDNLFHFGGRVAALARPRCARAPARRAEPAAQTPPCLRRAPGTRRRRSAFRCAPEQTAPQPLRSDRRARASETSCCSAAASSLLAHVKQAQPRQIVVQPAVASAQTAVPPGAFARRPCGCDRARARGPRAPSGPPANPRERPRVSAANSFSSSTVSERSSASRSTARRFSPLAAASTSAAISRSRAAVARHASGATSAASRASAAAAKCAATRSCSKPDSAVAAGVEAEPICRFTHFHGGLHHGLCAPRQAIDALHAGPLLPRLILVEGRIDAAQRCLQRNPSLAPGLDQRPIQRGKQQNRPAPLLEALLDLGKIIKVVAHYLNPKFPSGEH